MSEDNNSPDTEKCPSQYHNPTRVYCLDCLPRDAPLGALLISNRPPTPDEIKRGLELAAHSTPPAPPPTMRQNARYGYLEPDDTPPPRPSDERVSSTDWENLRPDGTRHRIPKSPPELETDEARIKESASRMRSMTEPSDERAALHEACVRAACQIGYEWKTEIIAQIIENEVMRWQARASLEREK